MNKWGKCDEMDTTGAFVVWGRVASRLVHEAEIEVYLGGMVIETIHAGEPLRRNAVVTADNPAVVRRRSFGCPRPSLSHSGWPGMSWARSGFSGLQNISKT